jgi:DNA-binding MarR family transcriptional regulator
MSTRANLLQHIEALETQLAAITMSAQAMPLIESNITVQQLCTLLFISSRDQIAINVMADLLHVKPNVATGIVQRLVDKGLLERHEDRNDRRIRSLRLSENGCQFVDKLTTSAQSRRCQLLGYLSDMQLIQLQDILQTLQDGCTAEKQ